MQLATTGEQGELCVRGTSLALGYYNDWEKTRKAFIQNPLNTSYPETIYCTGDLVCRNEQGEIIYLGRKDSQIKHNGYRIELGEIETAVHGTNMVDHCCVVYDSTNKRIAIFYQSEQELAMAEFRRSLLAVIPKYMIPTVFNRVEELRLSANGKIDRKFYEKEINGSNL
jgi:acyl-coenzyme A synthetase/AMP-(fatty) acid ligase